MKSKMITTENNIGISETSKTKVRYEKYTSNNRNLKYNHKDHKFSIRNITNSQRSQIHNIINSQRSQVNSITSSVHRDHKFTDSKFISW
jgi:hypothetical protein